MKLQIVSDIHTEHGTVPSLWNEVTRCDSDVIVVAGDFSSYRDVFKDLLDLHNDSGKEIVYTPGNHEYYRSSRRTLDPLFKEFTEVHPKIHVLVEDKCVIDGVLFIGSTGWWDGSGGTITERTLQGLNDFRYIYDVMDADQGLDWGRKSKKFFEEELYYNMMNGDYDKVVCLSHHMPHSQCTRIEYTGSPLNVCFCNHWDTMIKGYQPDLWIHGHTHSWVDFMEGKTRIICNPQGYPSVRTMRIADGQYEETYEIENDLYNPQLVVLI